MSNMEKYGHKSFNELFAEILEEKSYKEDIYGDEIKSGDVYYITKYKELVHEKNIVDYAEYELELIKKER